MRGKYLRKITVFTTLILIAYISIGPFYAYGQDSPEATPHIEPAGLPLWASKDLEHIQAPVLKEPDNEDITHNSDGTITVTYEKVSEGPKHVSEELIIVHASEDRDSKVLSADYTITLGKDKPRVNKTSYIAGEGHKKLETSQNYDGKLMSETIREQWTDYAYIHRKNLFRDYEIFEEIYYKPDGSIRERSGYIVKGDSQEKTDSYTMRYVEGE